jgi:anti-anti-sigma factor
MAWEQTMPDPPARPLLTHERSGERAPGTGTGPGSDVLPTPGGLPAVVVLTGELDMLTAPDVRRVLQDACEHADLVVDLSEVTFIDCSNLALLLEARNRLGPRLRLRRCSAPVQRLLALTGLLDTFAVVDAQVPRAPRQRTAGPFAAPTDQQPAAGRS